MNFSSEFEKESLVSFLNSNHEYSLFLLTNLKEHGPFLSDAPNSGNFYAIKREEEIVTVFVLTKRGSLLISSVVGEEVFPQILEACLKEPIKIQGVIGEWKTCKAFWEFLKKEKIIRKEVKVSMETLYSLSLHSKKWIEQEPVRQLQKVDFDQWFTLRNLYYGEMGFPNTLSELEQKGDYLTKVDKGIVWGYFDQDALISIADLNAFIPPLGQLGGVFTHPDRRREGLSRRVMNQVFHDCRHHLGVAHLTIFTGSHNVKAQSLYTSLGAKEKGKFALLFGR